MNKKLLVYFIFILVFATSFILPGNAHENLNNENLPDAFDWRDIDGKNFITPVKNQQTCQSCCTFAALAVLEAVVQIEYDTIFECDLSEAHLYFCSGASCDNGIGIPDTVDSLKDNGVSDDRCLPYESRDMDCDEKADNWRQRLVTVNTINIVWGPIDIKEALVEYGPVITYMDTYDDFKSYNGGIYEYEWGSRGSGNHAVTIIGYNDDPGYWLCKIDKGTDFGEEGYFRIKYGQCHIESEVYYLKLRENPAPEQPDTPSGETTGKPGEEYTYTTSSSDIENDDIYYQWDFGDDNTSDWLGPYESGNDCSISYIWASEGTFEIKVKSKDDFKGESEWSDPLEISMPKRKSITPFGLIFVFGFDVDVKIVQLEPGEDYVDLEILDKPLYIWENEIITRNPGEFIRLYAAKGLFSPSLPFCFGICEDWGIIG